jgi:heme/copper-type cytochrome/quinol oxidase subunit 3
MKQEVAFDVAELDGHGYGPRMTTWWGTVGLMAMEGMGLALACGAYVYIAARNPQWPADAPDPSLVWSSLMTLVMLLSLVPTVLLHRIAHTEDLVKVRVLLIIMSLFGLATLVIRGFEFTTLYVRWDTNAYGSVVWFLIVLHTTHILADVVDTMVLTVLMFTRHAHGKRFSDAEDDAIFWYFVVAAWLAIYGLIYWFPRFWGA